MKSFHVVGGLLVGAMCVSGELGVVEHKFEGLGKLGSGLSDFSINAVDENKVVVVGGCKGKVQQGYVCPLVTSDAFFYYPGENGRIQSLPPAPRGRYRHSSAIRDGLLYVIGGESTEIDVLDLETLQWITLPDTLPKNVTDGAAFILQDDIYYAGGYILPDYNHSASTYIIDSADKITVGPSMAEPVGDVQAVVLNDRAYLIGGWGSDWATDQKMEIFDPLTQKFTVHSAKMQYPRGDKAVAVMNGRIYVFGGQHTDQNIHSTIEIFDPSTGAWYFGGEMDEDRFRFSATAFGDNKIILMGGQYLKSASDWGGAAYSSNYTIHDTVEAYVETSGLYSMPTVVVHGSGTTNPSIFYWNVMEKFHQGTRIPLKMSYRAVGTSTGQKEFTGNNVTAFLPATHFGSGDLCLDNTRYEQITRHGHKIAQIPVGLGAIGVYVNIPEFSSNPSNRLVLSACDLAAIYKGEITNWKDLAKLYDANAWLGQVDRQITALHRDLGSSSTFGFTTYMKELCPSKWDQAGKVVQWPSGTVGEGSGGVQAALASTSYSIGYLSVGHGYPQQLRSIALVNKAGALVEATASTIAAAGSSAFNSAKTFYDDCSSISVINKAGTKSYPIVLVSYLYVRQDLTAMGMSASVLKAFVDYVLHPELGQTLISDHGFVALPSDVRDKAQAAAAQFKLPHSAPQFDFETKTTAHAGTSPYTISVKRQTYSDVQLQAQKATIDTLTTTTGDLKRTLGNNNAADDNSRAIAIAALVIACVNVLAVLVLAILFTVKKSSGAKLHGEHSSETPSSPVYGSSSTNLDGVQLVDANKA